MKMDLMKMDFLKVKTRLVKPPACPIWDILDDLDLRDGDIVFITSKVLAIHQGRCVKSSDADKMDLIKAEATHWYCGKHPSGFPVNLTITQNILIPSAGIDESNADGHYILWPKDQDKLTREIRNYLVKKNKISRLGVISTDSHTTPLRWGVTGITTGLSGVKPLRDIRGDRDLFGRELQMTQVNLIDPLTSVAVLLMGEGNEQIPIVILRGWNGIEFDKNGSMEDFKIHPDEDLYAPLLKVLDHTP